MKNNIDSVLILAAGKGTRMGEIGNVLPKVLWPIFDKTILELQVLYARSLGIKNIYINVFNHSEKILKHINQSHVFSGVHILRETQVLDIGGAIHNLANEINYQGNLLVLNCDQFYMIDKRIDELTALSANFTKILFTYPVETRLGYNTLVIEDNLLRGVLKKEDHLCDTVAQTYTGISLINLPSLKRMSGESKFFETIANYREEDVYCLEQTSEEYWDFGTTLRYYKSIMALVDTINDGGLFREFIRENCNLDMRNNKTEIFMGDLIIGNNKIIYKEIKQEL